jgi:hypothetical protein
MDIPNVPLKMRMEGLWELVGDALGFTVEVAQNFFIWGCENDLELLLFADSTIEEVRAEWPKYLKKWTNNSKIKRPFRFYFRPTSVVPIRQERNMKDPQAQRLFYLQVPTKQRENIHQHLIRVFSDVKIGFVTTHTGCAQCSSIELSLRCGHCCYTRRAPTPSHFWRPQSRAPPTWFLWVSVPVRPAFQKPMIFFFFYFQQANSELRA